MLYTLYPSHNNRDFSFVVKGNNRDEIYLFFKFDKDNSFLSKPRLNLTYDQQFEKNITEILKHDFYFCSNGLLLFSKNFYEKSKDFLNEDCQFFPCLVNNKEADIYAMYIKNKFNIKDYDAKTNTRKIFRDLEKPFLYAVTVEFIDFVKKENFLLKYLEL